MIKDDIEHLVTNGTDMIFLYGDKPTFNLQDGPGANPDQYHFWLLPVERKAKPNSLGQAETLYWELAWFIVTKDQIDGGTPEIGGRDYYDKKFKEKIQPIYDRGLLEDFQTAFSCLDPYTFEDGPTSREVINIFDWNVTGLYCTARVREDL